MSLKIKDDILAYQTKLFDKKKRQYVIAVCHNNGHSQQRQLRFRATPFAKYWTLCLKWRHEKHVTNADINTVQHNKELVG